MSLIIAEGAGVMFGAQEVLRNVSFRVAESDRIGLVGQNGEGKTTLLRIIAGQMEATTGAIHRRKGATVGYLPQDPPALTGTTIHGKMLDTFGDVRAAETELHDLSQRMGSDPELVEKYGRMQHEFEQAGGYEYTNRIEQVLTGLGFPRDMWERPLAELSGGQRTRVYLATLLLRPPDLLLLDEPTNHLDIEAREWLEQWVQSFRGAVVVVSHDRYLLDRVTETTWEIANRTVEAYRGAYTKFVELRDARHAERMQQWEAQQEYIQKTQEFIRIHMGSQRTNEAKGRRTRLERFLRDEAIEKPSEKQEIHLRLSAAKRTGDLVLRAEGLAAGYDAKRPLLHVDRLEVVRGDRIAIVGANGTGKTTLLRTLMGELASLAGMVRIGANVEIGTVSQTHHELDPAKTALETVQDSGERMTEEEARNLLGTLLLTGDDVFKQTGQLSGGQRSRILLARLMTRNPNLLMLDEPTNHLDISSTEIIQAALKRFDGTILFVSHDRYLIESVAQKVWAVDGGGVKVIHGGWEAYLKWRAERVLQAPSSEGTSKAERRESYAEREAARKEGIRLRKRLDQIEKKIERLEEEVGKLNAGLSEAAMAGALESLRELSKEHRRKDEELRALWIEWEKIGEQLAG